MKLNDASFQHDSLERLSKSFDPARMGFRSQDGSMWLDETAAPTLSKAGLAAFEQVMGQIDGDCKKWLPDREVWHLRVHVPNGETQGLFVKKHHVRTKKSWLRRWLGLPEPKPESAGRVEAENAESLRAIGLNVMRFLAYGERLRDDGMQESFIITEELNGFEELQRYLSRRFKRKPDDRSPRRNQDLMKLIGEVADIASRFHNAGYNHRDMYCCHFFVKEGEAGRRDIRLIDLQRVQKRTWLRRRWIVKDLAQLAWSAPRSCVKCTHRLAFFKQYMGVEKLRPSDKSLIRSILAKQRRMERRLGVKYE